MVGYMRRFAPAFLEAKEMLPSLGTINYARVRDIIGKNHLIIDQMWKVHRPGDIPEDMIADRWERAAELRSGGALARFPAAAVDIPAPVRPRQPRSVGHA